MNKVILPKEGEKVATEKEIKLVQAYANDQERPEIALSLGIGVRTLDGRLRRIRSKYGLKTMAGIVALFYKNGLIE